MSTMTDERLVNSRMDNDLAELAQRIAALIEDDGTIEMRPGVFLSRSAELAGRFYGSCEPSFCVIAQGSKTVQLGDDIFRYDPAHYLISTMELPCMAEVAKASAEEPYLSFRLVLDPSVVTSVMVESAQTQSRTETRAMDVSPLGPTLLDAALRLVRLLDSPLDYEVLGPLVVREIIYRLLAGPQGNRMRHLARLGGSSHRMVRAIDRIRRDFDKLLRVEEIAADLDMSVSGFHAHFKTATSMSPLQFQKQLRLQEARRLMLSESLDAAEAGFRVGYEDASHFNRDYKRLFGHPPVRDVARLRAELAS
ncbi:AraC family transcriptional regulator [Lacunimicrobium album]